MNMLSTSTVKDAWSQSPLGRGLREQWQREVHSNTHIPTPSDGLGGGMGVRWVSPLYTFDLLSSDDTTISP